MQIHTAPLVFVPRELFIVSGYEELMPSQHKPLPPLTEIRPHLELYFHLGQNDKDIAANLANHYDTELYSIGDIGVKRLRKDWGLKSTRQQNQTSESIAAAIAALRKKVPSCGVENIRKALSLEYGVQVSRKIVVEHLQNIEPDTAKAPRQRYPKQLRLLAVGVNDIWAQDRHDKWGPRFGLWLHNNIDPFTGFNNWLKVWWTNKSPRLIAGYYIETIRKYGGAAPLTTESGSGSENYGVANLQTRIRHELDPSLMGTFMHHWRRQETSIKSGGNWSVFRRDFAPGFEDLFESGVNQGWYDVNNHLENLVFRWLAIPWIQTELDQWMKFRNESAPRANPKKIRPHGIPVLIRQMPEMFSASDFKILVPSEIIDRLENEYAPPDHEVFQLTPTPFHDHALAHYTAMGEPPLTFKTFWDIYKKLLQRFRTANDETLSSVIATHFDSVERVIDQEKLPLLLGMKDLKFGDKVVGDLNAGNDILYVSFTD